MKPDFMIIGAMKAGSTTLYDALSRQDGLALPTVKEPRILKPGQSVEQVEAAYAKHFGQLKGIRGEGSTYYAMLPHFPDVSDLAAKVMRPDGKIIYLIREPVERILSHLRHDVHVGRLGAPLNFGSVLTPGSRYFEWSDYEMQFTPWVNAFGIERCALIEFSDLVGRQADVVAKVCEFLGTHASNTDVTVHSNASDQLTTRFNRPLLERLRRGGLYQRFVKPVLPGSLTLRLRSLLYPPPERIELDDELYGQVAQNPLVVELGRKYRSMLDHPARLRP